MTPQRVPLWLRLVGAAQVKDASSPTGHSSEKTFCPFFSHFLFPWVCSMPSFSNILCSSVALGGQGKFITQSEDDAVKTLKEYRQTKELNQRWVMDVLQWSIAENKNYGFGVGGRTWFYTCWIQITCKRHLFPPTSSCGTFAFLTSLFFWNRENQALG